MTLGVPSTLRSLHDQVTRQIALGILRGEIKNDESKSFTLDSFGRLFRVSRTVLRDSIKVLAAKGLVEARPNKGILVRPRTDWNLIDPDLLAWRCEASLDYSLVRDLCEIRLNLEPFAAELAAARASRDDLTAIDYWCGQMEALKNDVKAITAADMEFHSAVYNASHNDLVRQTSVTLRKTFQMVLQLEKTVRFRPESTVPMHREVADAISKRDGKTARTVTDQLVRIAVRDCYELLKRESPDQLIGFNYDPNS